VVGGMAGAIQVRYTGLAEPTQFGFELTVQLFAFVVLGGTTTFWGPIAGATFLTLALDLLSSAGKLSYLVFGALLLVVMRLRPDGVLTRAFRLRRKRLTRLLERLGSRDAAHADLASALGQAATHTRSYLRSDR
jgi:branched-chain amino acid transport system permease protein